MTVLLLLGSNQGDSRGMIEMAKAKIVEKFGGYYDLSALYKTAPWGKTDQNWFLNQVVHVLVSGSTPLGVLQTILEIEAELGRTRNDKWGPRLIDIDILTIGIRGECIIETPELTVPHPHLHERRFSLIPLKDVWPNWRHPILNQTIDELLENCPDKGQVIREE
jgi:2-amino-4-hydroxy-6-hydroxymethyldihydropteridine diphosphokinase